MFTFFKFWLILSPICALSNTSNDFNQFRYLGGYRPKPHMLAKYIVSIRRIHDEINFGFGTGHFSGGVIISQNTILTAADHMLQADISACKICVVAGSPIRLVEGESTQIINVSAIRTHEAFGKIKQHARNDIAILTLSTDIIEDGITAQRIPIASKKFPADTICTALGWGKILPRGPVAGDLVYNDLQIWSKKLCRRSHEQSKFIKLGPIRIKTSHTSSAIKKTHICTKDSAHSKEGMCKYDDGGPLICNGTLVGIASEPGRLPCGSSSLTLFTSVYEFRDWIKNRAFHHSAKVNLIPVIAVAVVYFF